MAKSPSEPFDPCREWLGIDRADLADPRRVLGLVPSETDPITVLRASEARLSLLKGLAAGPHHAARETLILRVEQAREAVLSQIASNGGQGVRVPSPGTGFAMPPPPRRPGATSTDPPADEGATVVFADAAAEQDADGDAPSVPEVRIRTNRPMRRRDNGASIWISILAMLASVAAGVGFIWWQAHQQQELRRSAKEVAKQAAGKETTQPAEDAEKASRAMPLPEDAAISSSPPLSTARPRPERKPVDARVAMAAPGPNVPPAEPVDASPPAAPPDDTEMAIDRSVAMDDAPAEGSSDTATEEALPESDSTAAGTAAVDAEIASALEALRESDFDTAEALLASALEGAEGIPAKQRVADWKVLAEYAREFAGFREKALAEVKPGNEFDVNGKKVGVVEIDDKKFIYRFQGRNKTVARDKIPAGILMAIVTTWFDERPANHLFLGAYHATKPEADLTKAKSHWELAEKGGINAAPLLGLLDDPILVGNPDSTANDSTEE